MTKFCRFDLRTTDADAARAFYTQLLGHDRSTIWPLHEQALARGARPHWLGNIPVDDPERVASAFVERGAMRLGPTIQRGDWSSIVLRDPGGAVVAISSPLDAPVDVVFHVLNTKDAPAAEKNYRELTGVPERSMIVGIEDRPGVHAHWLYFFPTHDLDASIAKARSLGAKTLEPATTPEGRRYCVIDDPQGAAFGLVQQ